jgi:hypothetical protein
MIIGLFVVVMLLVVTVCCWIWGDQNVVTKLIFTGLVIVSFGLCFLGETGNWIRLAMQAILVIVIGGSTFGSEWLSRRR